MIGIGKKSMILFSAFIAFYFYLKFREFDHVALYVANVICTNYQVSGDCMRIFHFQKK